MNQGMQDYTQPFVRHITPNPNALKPRGPTNFPMRQNEALPPNATPEQLMRRLIDIQQRLLDQMIRENVARKPIVRSKAIDQGGQTLDWSMLGLMDRVMFENIGPNTIYLQFDTNGPNVKAFASDWSFPVPANWTFNPDKCLFSRIGCICAAGETATVAAVAFQAVAGDLGGGIN